MKEYLELFLIFVKMGLSTFGGGYAIVPIAERELIKKRGWLTMDEVMDYYIIAQITPGIIAINLSTFVGYKQKGVLGGIVATIGFLLPGTTLIVIAALFISNIAELPAMKHAFVGIRIAVGTVLLDIVTRLLKVVIKDFKTLLMCLVVFAISMVPTGIIPSIFKSPVFLVLVSGFIGLFIFREKKNNKIESPGNSQEEGKGEAKP